MSPSIRIDPEVYSLLQTKAQAFVDTPNSVLRRLLGLEGTEPHTDDGAAKSTKAKPRKRAQRRKGRKKASPIPPVRRIGATPGTAAVEDYEMPILETLLEMGGSSDARGVVSAVGKKLLRSLSELDRERVQSGAERWETRVHFARLRLAEKGFLDRTAPRGLWRLSDQGRERAESASREYA